MPRTRDDTKVKAIFEATLRRVLKTGFNGLKMADVAKAARMATGTLYIYFKNKEELINQLYLQSKAAKVEQMMGAFNVSDDYETAFKKLWLRYLNLSLQEPERMIFIEQFTHSSYLAEKTKRQGDALLQPIEAFLQQGVRAGILRKIPVSLMVGQLLGPVNEIVKLHYHKQLKMTPALQQQAFQMAWNSVKA